MDNIYGMTPINKTAAVVTSQTGCATVMTDEQRRDNLVAKKKQLESELLTLPKKSKRRIELGKMISENDQEIRKIRPKSKCKGVEQHFIDVARSELTKFEFNRWMTIASEKYRAEKDKHLENSHD